MADKGFQVDDVSPAPVGNRPMGADQLSDNLKGIAPNIMEAFMKRAEPPVVAPTPAAEEPQATQADPESPTGTWPVAVLARRQEIQALLAAQRSLASEIGDAAAPPLPVDTGAGTGEHLAPVRARVGSGDGLKERLKEQHLALRATAKAARPVAEPDDPVLRRVLNSLRDQRIQGRLVELTQSINRMVPGGEGAVKLGSEIGKKVLVDNLNPVLALSLSTREVMSRVDTLRKWHALTGKERLTALAALTGNLAEILGALTPPPVNASVQVVGAGLSLMSMAAEHSETLETMAKQGTELAQRQVRRIIGPQAGVSEPVHGAWQALSDRLNQQAASQRPTLGAPWRWFFASRFYLVLKQFRWSATVAIKLENLAYNLAARRTALFARISQRWRHQIRRLRG